MRNIVIYFYSFFVFWSECLQARYCVNAVIAVSIIEKKHQIEALSPSETSKKTAMNGPVKNKMIEPNDWPIKIGAMNMFKKWRESDGNTYEALNILNVHFKW